MPAPNSDQTTNVDSILAVRASSRQLSRFDMPSDLLIGLARIPRSIFPPRWAAPRKVVHTFPELAASILQLSFLYTRRYEQ